MLETAQLTQADIADPHSPCLIYAYLSGRFLTVH
jgi:hypothetical protein